MLDFKIEFNVFFMFIVDNFIGICVVLIIFDVECIMCINLGVFVSFSISDIDLE